MRPMFFDVADSFMRSMDQGIFVAHNVIFDYGFVSYEYERLNHRFRFPKLCTVAAMRRRYPGHKSYALAKLCEVYGIELKNSPPRAVRRARDGCPLEPHQSEEGWQAKLG